MPKGNRQTNETIMPADANMWDLASDQAALALQSVDVLPTDTTNANTAIKTGFYRTTAAASNVPVAAAGGLLVYSAGSAANTYSSQIWSNFATNDIYMRSMNAGGWSAWRLMISPSGGNFTGIITMDANLIMDSNNDGASQPSRQINFYTTDASSVKQTLNWLRVDTSNDLYYTKLGGANLLFHAANHGATGDPHSQYLLKAGGGTVSNSFGISGVAPLIVFTETDAAADAKKWWFVLDGGTLGIRTVNDAETVMTYPLSITRAGALTSENNTLDNGTNGGSIFNGQMIINAGGGGLALKPGSNDHTYIEFYARSATPTTRTAFIGYSSAAATTMNITNSISGGNTDINTTGVGVVRVNGSTVHTDANHGATGDPHPQYLLESGGTMTGTLTAAGIVVNGSLSATGDMYANSLSNWLGRLKFVGDGTANYIESFDGIAGGSTGNKLLRFTGANAGAGTFEFVGIPTISDTAAALVLANTTATTGRTYSIRSNSAGSFNIYDNTGAVARVTIDNAGGMYLSNGLTVATGATITAGGLTVSAGTTNTQALTVQNSANITYKGNVLAQTRLTGTALEYYNGTAWVGVQPQVAVASNTARVTAATEYNTTAGNGSHLMYKWLPPATGEYEISVDIQGVSGAQNYVRMYYLNYGAAMYSGYTKVTPDNQVSLSWKTALGTKLVPTSGQWANVNLGTQNSTGYATVTSIVTIDSLGPIYFFVENNQAAANQKAKNLIIKYDLV